MPNSHSCCHKRININTRFSEFLKYPKGNFCKNIYSKIDSGKKIKNKREYCSFFKFACKKLLRKNLRKIINIIKYYNCLNCYFNHFYRLRKQKISKKTIGKILRTQLKKINISPKERNLFSGRLKTESIPLLQLLLQK